MKNTPFFIIDVESVGLHGEGFAVAGGVYIDGIAQPGTEFRFCCPQDAAEGGEADRRWVKENVPEMEVTHQTPFGVREMFWERWRAAVQDYPGVVMAAECQWPVEARFVAQCVDDFKGDRNWKGPYPLHEIASFMLAAGMDPMAKYERLESEMPAHEPLADVRLSARLLAEALRKISP